MKYNLCPFAEQVFTTERVRYAMSLTASTREQIITKFKEEVYYILTHPEDVIETTLIVLPFAMKDFEDWYDFTLELEEDVLPGLLKEIHNKSTFRNSKATPVASGGRLAQRLLKKQKASEEKDEGEDEDDELQIACFHPTFMWSSEDDEDPLADFNHPMHYEKRAPFPTINILRTKQIQAFASQVRPLLLILTDDLI